MTAVTCPNIEIADQAICPSPGRASVESEALQRLRRAGYSALQNVACRVDGPDLCLSGRLPSYYLKQVAQAVAAEVQGVRRVINRIQVVTSSARRKLGDKQECHAETVTQTLRLASHWHGHSD